MEHTATKNATKPHAAPLLTRHVKHRRFKYVFQSKMSTANLQARSKAYRITLPGSLLEQDLQQLHHWARNNCSSFAIWRQNGQIIWVANRERARTQEAFMRHLQNVFNALCLTKRPNGRWLTLLTEEEAKQLIHENHDAPAWSAAPKTEQQHGEEKLCLLAVPRRGANRREETTHTARLSSGFTFEIVRE